jgi:hypothetical protein
MITPKSIAADGALVTTTSAWAIWLWNHKEFEPDWTWVQVVAGCGLCLGHAYIQGRLLGGDWHAHHMRIFRSFVIGGLPIIAGEVTQWLALRAERQRL